jgi:hypothetical protein
MEFCVSNDVVTPDLTRLFVRSDQHPIEVSGPYSKRGKTLPNYSSIHQIGENLYQATVLDPAIWTPEHPVFYRIKFADNQTPAIVGIRKNEVCGKSVFVDGRRHVFRTALIKESQLTPSFADLRLSILLQRPDTNTLETATYQGVPVILEAGSESELENIARFSSWPCVFGVILAANCTSAIGAAALSANALRLARLESYETSLPNWAHGAVMSFDSLVSTAIDLSCPVFAERKTADFVDEARIRRSCEQLQCDLAPQYNLAGYIVS